MSFERKNIEKMQGYAPGEQTRAAGTIKLNTNENPYPPSPQVAKALKSIDVAALRRYPSPMAIRFEKPLAGCTIYPQSRSFPLMAVTNYYA